MDVLHDDENSKNSPICTVTFPSMDVYKISFGEVLLFSEM